MLVSSALSLASNKAARKDTKAGVRGSQHNAVLLFVDYLVEFDK